MSDTRDDTQHWHPQRARVGFFGSTDFSIFTLNTLIKSGINPVIVFSQPGRARGRGQYITPTIVTQVARKHHLEVHTPEQWSDEVKNLIAQAQLDVAIVVAYGLILPKKILNLPKYGCLNVHPSALPRWRGAAPIQRTVEAGDHQSAVCIIRMDEGIDTGNILWQQNVTINAHWDAGDWHDEAARIGARGVLETLATLPQAQPKPQVSSDASYATMISRQETQINFHQPAEVVINHLRAFSPKPGAWCLWRKKRFRLFSARIVDQDDKVDDESDHEVKPSAGKICDSLLTIQTAQGRIRPRFVQLEGKKKMSSEDFLRGHDLKVGEYLTGRDPE